MSVCPSLPKKSRSVQTMLRLEQAGASKSALTDNLDSNGRRGVALRGEDNSLSCPLCMYAVPPLEVKRMNCHTCTTNKLFNSSITPASSSNRPHACIRIPQPNSPLPDALVAVYTTNLWRDEHLAKFSLAFADEPSKCRK